MVCTVCTKCYLGDQIKKYEMGLACSMYGERRGAYKNLMGKRERKRPLGRPRRRLENDINMNL